MLKYICKQKCSGCGACIVSCPKQCIKMEKDNEGFLFPKINHEECVNCGLCRMRCPVINHIDSDNIVLNEAYAVKNPSDEVRMKSSSGGAFSALASLILKKNGVVFGAKVADDYSIIHSFLQDSDDICYFRGSKYAQSNVGDSYKLAKNFLMEDRYVLYTGTPCQIAGLKSFLGKDYKKLITQDIICHGVASPEVWKKYVDYRIIKANNSLPIKIEFREKTEGWRRFSMSFIFDNGVVYRANLNDDPMLQVFLNNLCLRQSCYDCSFKGIKRESDLTFADYWGVKNIHPEFDDDKGASLILVNTIKGKEIFEELKEELLCIKTDKMVAVSYNKAMFYSVKKTKDREAFLSKVTSKNFDKLAKKYCKGTFYSKSLSKLKAVLRKIIRKK